VVVVRGDDALGGAEFAQDGVELDADDRVVRCGVGEAPALGAEFPGALFGVRTFGLLLGVGVATAAHCWRPRIACALRVDQGCCGL
jgi:hypothetical protein